MVNLLNFLLLVALVLKKKKKRQAYLKTVTFSTLYILYIYPRDANTHRSVLIIEKRIRKRKKKRQYAKYDRRIRFTVAGIMGSFEGIILSLHKPLGRRKKKTH
jgi:hypothetical protein